MCFVVDLLVLFPKQSLLFGVLAQPTAPLRKFGDNSPSRKQRRQYLDKPQDCLQGTYPFGNGAPVQCCPDVRADLTDLPVYLLP